MLTIFRRHMKDRKFRGRKHRNCQCPIAVEGTLHGRMVRKSLDLRTTEKHYAPWVKSRQEALEAAINAALS